MALLLTIVFGSFAILTSWVPPRGRFYLIWARIWARCVLYFAGIRVVVEGSEASRSLPGAVFMPNHQSAVDILSLFLAIPHEVFFLAKRSLFYIPFLGWSMWLAGFIPVDRERTDHAREVFSSLEKRLKRGVSVLVFPEGTRSRTGSLGSFKKSGFLAAIKTGMPIVPVGISGARQALGTEGLLVTPGRVVVRLGEPIPTAGLTVAQRPELMAAVRAEILRLAGCPDGGKV